MVRLTDSRTRAGIFLVFLVRLRLEHRNFLPGCADRDKERPGLCRRSVPICDYPI